jgi:1,4-alpha-glucan branching enzyme
MALHKMIRLATVSIGGEGYLNFMGNEFGHPEWIDFPREGNGWSYFYCRRQWSLSDNGFLKYGQLKDFDREMISLSKEKKLFKKAPRCLYIDDGCKILTYERAGVVFALNFSPSNSYEGYCLTVPSKGRYKVIMSTDREEFGGYGRISEEYVYTSEKHGDGKYKIRIYLPARTGLVLEKIKNK